MSVATLDSRDHSQTVESAGRRRALRLWLWTLAAMVLAMVVLAMAVVHWRLCAGVPAQR